MGPGNEPGLQTVLPYPFVLVGGLPRSGNRLIMRMIEHHGLKAHVHHHMGGWCEVRVPMYIIVPTRIRQREALAAKRATQSKAHVLLTQEEHEVKHAEMLEFYKDTPTMHLAYETLVEHPTRTGREIAKFVGIRGWVRWPEPIFDGDAKYREA